MFGGYPAKQVTRELRELAGTLTHELDRALQKATGPHDLLLAAAGDPRLAARIEGSLQDAELKAVESALPTLGAAESMAAFRSKGKLVAIVSNNYAVAVQHYLARAGLSDRVTHVEGRDPSNPTLMKPSPHLIENAARALGVDPASCIFIGDQPSDMTAGRTAGTYTVGYANKPGKANALSAAGADAVVYTMVEIATAVR